ncbi:MAG: uncharacterized protein JWN48_4613 [Myxococcaceae bacterium]|nr:uncharacterized protein [Myxococcaceae bacterium]
MLRSVTWIMAAAAWLCALCAQADNHEDSALSRELDERLQKQARLAWITAYARERSSVLAESTARARSASERASASGRLPDLELKYEQWAVPLSRPYDLRQANPLMFGLRQAFPAPGTRQARARMSAADAEIAQQQRRATERDLIRRIRKAYFEYYAADQVLQLRAQHVVLTEQMLSQLRGSYEAGRGRQQDLLKALVELSRLHNSIAEGQQQRDSSRFLLNALMGRSTDAALGPPEESARVLGSAVQASTAGPVPGLRAQELERQQGEARPEIAAARSATQRALAAADAAHHAARRPAFMVGADYWVSPSLSAPNAYGAMVSMSLPWLNPEHRAEARAADQTARAERHAADTVQTLASLELHQAVAGFDAARASLAIVEHELLPQAEQGLQAIESAFASGQSDLLSLLEAQRSLFELRLERSRAYARVLSQLADVEFASGMSLFDEGATEAQP